MADEQQELRKIDWAQTFGFTYIFKSFKMAVHPSKIALCLMAIVVVFLVGWTMDQFWSASGQYVREGEIYAHFSQPKSHFNAAKERWLKSRLDNAAGMMIQAEEQYQYLESYKAKLPRGYLKDAFLDVLADRNKEVLPAEPKMEQLKEDYNYEELLGKVIDRLDDETEERIVPILAEAKQKALEDIGEFVAEEETEGKATQARLETQLADHMGLAMQAITKRKLEVVREVQQIRGAKIFASLLEYERRCINNSLWAVRHGNIFGGTTDYRNKRAAKAITPMTATVSQIPEVTTPLSAGDRPGFFYWCLLAFHGIVWLACEHWIYATIFLLVSLAAVAFFGGAVHRVSALHFTREEKISITQAMRFSYSKFLSYFTAPLIPLAVILGVGVTILTVGGLIGSIPGFGSIFMGLFFFVALAFGLIIAFLLIGLVAGAPLMYPTIAVEGSDSFDAISRSFSYVFARPWRSALYGLVALIYGTVTYLFVRLFVCVAMMATHLFVSWGVIGGGERLHVDADKLDIMWPAPTYDSLTGPAGWESMGTGTALGAWLMGVWVFLLAATVLAYLLSFSACSTTVIYCLLRRKVDATDLDDVYVEDLQGEAAPEQEMAAEQDSVTDQNDPSSSPDTN